MRRMRILKPSLEEQLMFSKFVMQSDLFKEELIVTSNKLMILKKAIVKKYFG